MMRFTGKMGPTPAQTRIYQIMETLVWFSFSFMFMSSSLKKSLIQLNNTVVGSTTSSWFYYQQQVLLPVVGSTTSSWFYYQQLVLLPVVGSTTYNQLFSTTKQLSSTTEGYFALFQPSGNRPSQTGFQQQSTRSPQWTIFKMKRRWIQNWQFSFLWDISILFYQIVIIDCLP